MVPGTVVLVATDGLVGCTGGRVIHVGYIAYLKVGKDDR